MAEVFGVEGKASSRYGAQQKVLHPVTAYFYSISKMYNFNSRTPIWRTKEDKSLITNGEKSYCLKLLSIACWTGSLLIVSF